VGLLQLGAKLDQAGCLTHSRQPDDEQMRVALNTDAPMHRLAVITMTEQKVNGLQPSGRHLRGRHAGDCRNRWRFFSGHAVPGVNRGYPTLGLWQVFRAKQPNVRTDFHRPCPTILWTEYKPYLDAILFRQGGCTRGSTYPAAAAGQAPRRVCPPLLRPVEAIARAFHAGVSTMQKIADYFGVHNFIVSRAVCRFESVVGSARGLPAKPKSA